jgi:hypothetical protein
VIVSFPRRRESSVFMKLWAPTCAGVTKRIQPFALLLLLAVAPAQAALLDDIAANLKQHKITRGLFHQEKTLPILSQPLISSGRFLYDAERGVLWCVEQPVNSTVVITAQGIFADGTQLTAGNGSAMLQNIFKGLLSGDLHNLQTQFDVRGEGSREQWQMLLTPRAQPLAAAINSIVLSGGRDAQQLTINERQGGVTRLKLLQQEHPQQLSAAEQQEFVDAR